MAAFHSGRRKILKRLSAGALGVLSGACTTALTGGCRSSSKRKRIAGLTPEAGTLISEIAETIVPETETPGAKTAGVGLFVIRILADCRSQAERESFVKGLDEFEQGCFSQFGHSFIKCTPQQKLSLLEKLDSEALGLWSKIKERVFHQNNFFKTLKELVLIGYFTSRQGATRALSYDPIPGKWIVCLKMKPGQKGWATH